MQYYFVDYCKTELLYIVFKQTAWRCVQIAAFTCYSEARACKKRLEEIQNGYHQ